MLLVWMHNLDALQFKEQGLNPIGVVLLKQVSLVLPLQWACAYDAASKLNIHKGVDLLDASTSTQAVEQTWEVLDVCVQLEDML